MAGVAIQVEAQGLEHLQARLAQLSDPALRTSLLEAVTAEIESQTHRRIREGGPGPDGVPWEPWSEAYAATRHGGQGLLFGEGDLDDAIQALVEVDDAEVGLNLVYGAIHQFGGEEVGIPIKPRPYLGLSADDEADLDAIIDVWLEGQIQ